MSYSDGKVSVGPCVREGDQDGGGVRAKDIVHGDKSSVERSVRAYVRVRITRKHNEKTGFQDTPARGAGRIVSPCCMLTKA